MFTQPSAGAALWRFQPQSSHVRRNQFRRNELYLATMSLGCIFVFFWLVNNTIREYETELWIGFAVIDLSSRGIMGIGGELTKLGLLDPGKNPPLKCASKFHRSVVRRVY